MDALINLANLETVEKRPLSDVINSMRSGETNTVDLAISNMWFDMDDPDYQLMNAYEEAFNRVAEEIGQTVGETARRQLGFDEETFEPVSFLERLDIFCDFYCHWPENGLLLTYEHEDKELPIIIGLTSVAS